MSAPDPQTCEVKIEGAWRSASFVEAKTIYAMLPKRCPSCHGSVSINGNYSGTSLRRTMAHRKAHDGCPLMPERFSGTASRHPKGLE